MKGAIAAGLVVLASGQAQAQCWTAQRAAAARVRDLQSKLMVAAMRCNAMKIDILPAYNAFVTTNRGTIQAANEHLKAHFAVEGADPQAGYDSFTTSLANAYGAETTDVPSCARMVGFAAEAVAAQGDAAMLLTLADKMGPTPALPGGTCPISFSAASQP